MSDIDIFQGGSEPLGNYIFNFCHFEAFSALRGQGVFIKISSKSTFQLFLTEGSDSYQKLLPNKKYCS